MPIIKTYETPTFRLSPMLQPHTFLLLIHLFALNRIKKPMVRIWFYLEMC
ncbi:unknown [Prevotella sp. CAG:891]|nr:unknown [Prevotella sp. CAG:891]